MSKKQKILLVILGILIVLVIALVIIKNTAKEEKAKVEIVNENEGVISSKEVSNVVFDNIKYVYDGEKTVVNLDIFNFNEKKIKIGLFIVNVYDENNKLLDTFAPVCNKIIEVEERKSLEFSLEKDLSKAYRLEFELPNLELIEE